MKGKTITVSPNRLIHLSDEYHDGEWFIPRVPGSIGPNEDERVKRVCFSTSISGAYRAIKDCCYWHNKFYVHVPYDIEEIARRGKLYKPTVEQVYDVKETGEYWVRCKVKMRCIGSIRIWFDRNDNIRFKWIERL